MGSVAFLMDFSMTQILFSIAEVVWVFLWNQVGRILLGFVVPRQVLASGVILLAFIFRVENVRAVL